MRLLELLEAFSAVRSLRPLQRDSSATRSWSDGRMTDVMAYIQENISESVSVPEAARRAGLTPNAFCRYFKLQTRRTFTEFINALRITEACRLLSETTGTVADVCHASSFSSLPHFHSVFKKQMNVSPKHFRNAQARTRGASTA